MNFCSCCDDDVTEVAIAWI